MHSVREGTVAAIANGIWGDLRELHWGKDSCLVDAEICDEYVGVNSAIGLRNHYTHELTASEPTNGPQTIFEAIDNKFHV